MNPRHLDAEELETLLITAIEDDLGALFGSAVSFADAGYMTDDSGFVVRFADGAEFQVTVVQSKFGEDDEQ